jgi:Zn-dependent protease
VPLKAITPYFRYWRTIVALDREVVDAVVSPAHQGPSPELQSALEEWPGKHYWSYREGPNRLVLIRSLRPPPRERWWLHIVLFLVTFATVWMAGSVLVSPPANLAIPLSLDLREAWADIQAWISLAAPGLIFAAALMGTLLAHELGHYFVAQRYGVNASPPYFLPAPPWLNFIGTFGAFIRLRSPIVDRRQLLDVGAAGPWAGFVVAAVVLVIGLLRSEVLEGVEGVSQQLVYWGQRKVYLGDSILLRVVRESLLGEGTFVLHPLALAGWVGLLVTMLNLLPLGQLDGGHILYSLIGRHQGKVGLLMLYGLVVLGFVYKFYGWWIWAALILLLGRGRISHPSVLDPCRPIPASRWPTGLATAVLFVVTFTPDPLHIL